MKQQHSSGFLDRLGETIGSRAARVVLALLIVLSVLPSADLETQLRPVFVGVFGMELLVRLLLLLTSRGAHHSERSWVEEETQGESLDFERRFVPVRQGRLTLTDLLFLSIDLVAFLSFLPLDSLLGVHAHGLLTSLRLVRLLVLLRFVRAVLHDLYAIVVRRERFQQFALVTFSVMALSFIAAVLLAQLEIPHPYDGNASSANSFRDQLWWAFRQLESADNLVPNLHAHPLIVVISLLLTVTGVFIISFIIGLGSSVVEQLFQAEQRRPVSYTRHSLIIGSMDHAEVLVREFVRIYNKHRSLQNINVAALIDWMLRRGPAPRRHALPRMVLLGHEPTPPHWLNDPFLRWVLFRHGAAADPAALVRAGAQNARRTIFLAPRNGGSDADGMTLVSLASFRAVNPHAHVFVEVLESANGPLMERVGGRNTFPLDMPRFLGLFLCQHLIVPGVEFLYRDLLTSSGSEFYTHILVEQQEREKLRAYGPDAYVSFSRLAALALKRFGILITGVFLGEHLSQRESNAPVPIDGLIQWVNPLQLPADEPALVGFGGLPGLLPLRTLAGFIAVAESYVPLQRFGRVFIQTLAHELLERHACGGAGAGNPASGQGGAVGEPSAGNRVKGVAEKSRDGVRSVTSVSGGARNEAPAHAEPAEVSHPLHRLHTHCSHGRAMRQEGMQLALPGGGALSSAHFRLDDGGLRRVLIVGYSPSLPFILRELARFVPGIEVFLVMSTQGVDDQVLFNRLSELGIFVKSVDSDRPLSGSIHPLEPEGKLSLYTTNAPGLADYAAQCLNGHGPVDAAVFLSDAEAEDKDARVALRLMRFARALETGRAPRGERLHVVAEFVSLARGRNVQTHLRNGGCGFHRPDQLRLTLVSTELIRNYFMVHSAFVPGVTALYDELLSERGQELVRLSYEPCGREGELEITFPQLQHVLMDRNILPLAVELVDGRVVLNPLPTEAFRLRQVRAVFVVMDGEHRTAAS